MLDTRERESFQFWLDLKKPEEYILADTIFELKRRRAFVSTVRDGIRLIVSLRQGRVDVLFELFPWTCAQLNSGAGAQLPAGQSTPQPTPRPLSIPAMPGPADDDDGDLLNVVKAKSSGDSAQNFLNAAFGLIQ